MNAATLQDNEEQAALSPILKGFPQIAPLSGDIADVWKTTLSECLRANITSESPTSIERWNKIIDKSAEVAKKMMELKMLLNEEPNP